MYKVISIFRDKYNPQKLYKVGDKFEAEDKNRIKDLISRRLITKAPKNKDNKKAAE